MVSNPRREDLFLPSCNKNTAELVHTKCPGVLVALFELRLNVPLVLKDLQNRNSETFVFHTLPLTFL